MKNLFFVTTKALRGVLSVALILCATGAFAEDEAYVRNVGETGFGTFSAACSVIVPEGVTVYETTYDAATNTVTATPCAHCTVIPANTGVIVKGEANKEYTYNAAIAAGSAVRTALSAASKGIKGNGTTTFGLLRSDAVMSVIPSFVTLPSNYAYIDIPASTASESKAVNLVIEENAPTAVKNVEASDAADAATKKYFKDGQVLIKNAKGTYSASGSQVK